MGGVPANIIIPFVGVEFDSSRANPGPAEVPINLLIIGQRLSTGTVPANTKFLASTADEVAQGAGFSSQLHRMAMKVFKNNKTVPVTFIGLDEAGGAAAATHATDISGTVTKAGELVLYVAGQRYAVTANVGDSAAILATALAALITADAKNIQATALYDVGTLTITALNKGLAAGDLDVRFNYNEGERLPEGISVTSFVVTDGTGDPDVTDALGALGDSWYNVIAQPFTDNTNLNEVEDYLDSISGPMEQRDGMSIQFKRDTRTAMITFGTDVANRNSQWTATFPGYKRMESTYELAAGLAAAVAVSIQEDPAVPLHRMRLVGFDVLDSNDTWRPTERNDLAKASIGTLTDNNGVQTEACVTMYRENSAGAADTAYQQMNTVFTLSALRYTFINHILTKYPRAKLSDSAENVEAGQQIMTPDIGRTEAVAWFRQMQGRGWVEGGQANLDQFQAELQVTRDPVNKNRLNWLLPPDLMNQFIVGSGVMQFIG